MSYISAILADRGSRSGLGKPERSRFPLQLHLQLRNDWVEIIDTSG
jgi:hypothetical protein